MNVSNLAIAIAPGPEPTPSLRPVPAPVLVGMALSPREGQIIGLIDRGMTSKEVAYELGVSDATVRVLISRALRKLGRPRRRRT